MYPKEILAAQALAGTLMAACLACAGGIGILAAILRIDWRWRVGMCILLLSPLLALSAVEVFWMLALQIVWVVIGVRLANRLLFGRTRYSSGSEKPGSPARFTIASLLFGTAIAAGGVLVIKDTPALNGAAWRSLALIAFASSTCVVIAWTAAHLKWRGWLKWPLAVAATSIVTLPLLWLDFLLPSMTFLGWQGWQGWPPIDLSGNNPIYVAMPTLLWLAVTPAVVLWLVLAIRLGRRADPADGPRWLFVVALTSPLIALLGWASFHLIPVPPPANGTDDEHEAFDRMMAIVSRMTHSRLDTLRTTYGELELIPAEKLKVALKPIENDLEDLIEQLRRPITVRLAYDGSDLNGFSNIRSAATALLGLGNVRASAQRLDEAMEAYFAAVKLGIKARRGGLITHDLVGRAVTGISLQEVCRYRNRASNEERAKVRDELIHLIGQLETTETVEERDRHWSTLLGWNVRLQLLISETVGAVDGLTGPVYRNIRSTELAEMWLLVLELSLSSYFVDHGRLPEHLDELVPEYLSELPADPYARLGQKFQYSATSAGYRLYSVGENGVDDGGMAHPSDPVSGMIDRTTGDIMF